MAGMQKKEAAALLYRLPEISPQGANVRQLLAAMKIRAITVEESDSGKTLAQLLGLAGGAAGECSPLPQEPVLVLYRLNEKHMNRLLQQLQATTPVDLKAAVTPVNKGWTFAKLCTELCRERAAFQARTSNP